MTHKTHGVAVATLAVIVAGYALWSASKPESGQQGTDGTSVSLSEHAAATEAPIGARSPQPSRSAPTETTPASAFEESASAVTLPPSGVPLKDVLDDLKERAARGDARAACRLSADLTNCHFLPVMRERLAAEIDQAARGEQGSLQDVRSTLSATRISQLVKTSERICAGVEPGESREAWRYLLQAANQGHVDSMLRFAIQPPLNEERFAYDFEGWAAYRESAIPLLERARAAGSTLALYHLFWAHAGWPMPAGIEQLHRDPVRAYAYGQVLLQVLAPTERARLEKRVQAIGASLSPEQRDEARTWISKMSADLPVVRSEDAAPLSSPGFSFDGSECAEAELDRPLL
jgi:hypothetical protein